VTPSENPADFTRDRNKISVLRKPAAAPVALEACKAALQFGLIAPTAISTRGELPRERYFTRAYILGFGKSFHSSWTNSYQPGCVSFDLAALKRSAEECRVQGSVCRIESIPMLVLRYGHGDFAIAPINEKGQRDYGALAAEMERHGPWNFWKALPEKSDNWLLTFQLGAACPAAESYAPFIAKAMRGGTPHPLAWRTLEGGGYPHFFRFAHAVMTGLPQTAMPKAVRVA
jgi:hypothetical protein